MDTTIVIGLGGAIIGGLATVIVTIIKSRTDKENNYITGFKELYDRQSLENKELRVEVKRLENKLDELIIYIRENGLPYPPENKK